MCACVRSNKSYATSFHCKHRLWFTENVNEKSSCLLLLFFSCPRKNAHPLQIESSAPCKVHKSYGNSILTYWHKHRHRRSRTHICHVYLLNWNVYNLHITNGNDSSLFTHKLTHLVFRTLHSSPIRPLSRFLTRSSNNKDKRENPPSTESIN